MFLLHRIFLILFCIGSCTFLVNAQVKQSASVWLTDPKDKVLFEKQNDIPFTKNDNNGNTFSILIDEKQKFQSIDGFGFALTGGSALNLMKMSKEARAALLRELFANDKNNIGTSYLRISVGASDLDDHVFSYDDLAPGQTDTGLIHFDLGYDKQNLIPVLKEILKINPNIKIMASPWSPPVWMKDNKDTRGGSLLKEYYSVYARYLVKYIREMRKQGIRIDALTVQNEPLHPGNNPSLLMLAPDQADFVKNHLGPVFRRAKMDTKIIVYDHNADKPEYPISILDNPEAKKYIDGSAFHMYGGKIEALSKVHDAHPDKNIYFTEQWIGAPGNLAGDLKWHIETLIIGATRNWAKTVIEWNLASDTEYKPYTDRGGCKTCLGAVTIAGNQFARNPAYYIIAHAAKFVKPGSVRIQSTMPDHLPNVAFRRLDGKTVLIVLNTSGNSQTTDLMFQNKKTTITLSAGAVATIIW